MIQLSPNQPRDRHKAALSAGILARCGVLTGTPEAQRPKDWDVFARMRLLDLAAEACVVDGCDPDAVRRAPPATIAMAAMGFGQRQLGNSAVHTTGTLPEITRDAVNKSLRLGYEEAPSTWRGPMRQGASVPDFKGVHRIALSAAGNLPVWPDNSEPEQAKLADVRESYAIEARAETLSFSWRLILNDDLDVLSRRPQLLGASAARTVNLVAWQAILANPTMADGQPLFLESPTGQRYRSNLTTGAATPTNESIGAMKAKMRVMRGLNTPEGNESDDILNLMPTYIVAPAALEETVLKQVFSGADPAAGGNSAVYNTSRTLEPIIEPLLDNNSAKAWYLFASPARVDTAEVTFLEGQETPFAHEWMDDRTMSQNYTIIQTFGAKAIDHRGIQKHAGE